ncbi:MAG: hypothetical protein R6T98_01765 [Desulfatiglandales bacterium]
MKNLVICIGQRETMGFFEVTGGRGVSFRNVSVGEPAAPSLSRGMRRGQNSPMDTLLKRPTREPWN